MNTMTKQFASLILTGLVLAGVPGAAMAGSFTDASTSGHSSLPALTQEQQLGKALFFDTSLSHPNGQSCSSCHSPSTGFTDPDQSNPTSNGVDPSLFGSRNAPTAAYQAFSPDFHFDASEGLWVGGQFLDGRSATLEEQAKQPFLNPSEMANTHPSQVITDLQNGPNAAAFQQVYGPNAFDDVTTAYNSVANAIASYERSAEVSPFSSRFDLYLQGRLNLTLKEKRGLDAFNDPNKGNCAACHISDPLADGTPPLFTDFTYDNIGIPKNHESGFLTNPNNPDGTAFVDLGLGPVVGDSDLDGAFKVSTLRNLAITAPYGHNGYFDSLEQIIEFYATRDVKVACVNPNASAAEAIAMNCWPASEVPHTVNADELGNLPLTAGDIGDMVAFLDTLTDGYDINTVVPVPSSALLLVSALVPFACYRRRRRTAKQET